MEYYLAINRNELSGHKKMWRNTKCILLREINQSEKTVIPIIVEKVKLWSLVAWGWAGREGGMNRWNIGIVKSSEIILYDSV